MIHEQGAARGEGVESGYDFRSQENIKKSVAIEICRGHRADAEGKRRQGVSRGRSQISVAIVEIESGVVGRGTPRLPGAGSGGQKIIPAGPIGLENKAGPLMDRPIG